LKPALSGSEGLAREPERGLLDRQTLDGASKTRRGGSRHTSREALEARARLARRSPDSLQATRVGGAKGSEGRLSKTRSVASVIVRIRGSQAAVIRSFSDFNNAVHQQGFGMEIEDPRAFVTGGCDVRVTVPDAESTGKAREIVAALIEAVPSGKRVFAILESEPAVFRLAWRRSANAPGITNRDTRL